MSTSLGLFTVVRTAPWRIGVIVLAACCGLAGAYAVTSLLTPTYQARSSVVVMYADDVRAADASNPPTGQRDGDESSRFDLSMLQAMVPTVAHLAESANVVQAAARSARVPSGHALGRADATYEPGDTIITLTASATSPEEASGLANAVADVVHEQVSGGRMVLGRRGVLAAQPLDRASPPDVATMPKPALNLALGGLLGLLLGVAIVVLGAQSDARLRSPTQVETALGTEVLGVVPKTRRLREDARQAFRRRRVAASVRSTVAALAPYAALPGRRLLVTSPTESEPTTFVAALLGLGLVEQGLWAALIDTGLGRPGLARHFPECADESLQRLLATGGELSSTRPEGLRVVPADAGTPSVSRRLLSSLAFRSLVGRATSRCDLVILNGPPVLAGADLSALADQVDSVILVVSSGSTEESEARRAARILHQFGLPLAGVVIANGGRTGIGGAGTSAVGGKPEWVPQPGQPESAEQIGQEHHADVLAPLPGPAKERPRHEAGSPQRW
ncbi:hypothetical protein [Flindersiella endophytica]